MREQHPRIGPGETGERPPDFANRFSVMLRLERKNQFYIVQIFGLTIVITMSSTLPLLVPSGAAFVGDRLGLYAGGVLTLTAFKYSIGDRLPSVPYSTKLDRIILIEIVSVISCALEAVVAYRYVDYKHKEVAPVFGEGHFLKFITVARIELALFVILTIGWFFVGLHLCAERMNCRRLARCLGMKFKSWSTIIENQEWSADIDEIEDWEHKEDLESERHGAKQLASLSLQICRHLARRGPTDEIAVDRERLSQLKEKRDKLEGRLYSAIPSAAKTNSSPSKTARIAPKASGTRLASSKTPSKLPRKPMQKV